MIDIQKGSYVKLNQQCGGYVGYIKNLNFNDPFIYGNQKIITIHYPTKK